MSKVRIHEIAKDMGYPSKEILEKAKELGIDVKSASSSVDEEVAAAIYEYIQTKIIPEAFKEKAKKASPKKETKETKEEKKEKSPSKAKEKSPKSKAKEEVKEEKKVLVKEETIKEEPKKEINLDKQEEANAPVSLNQRRGLVIVKKKKDENLQAIQEEKKAPKNAHLALKDMFSLSQEESLKRPKKKDKKAPQSHKKENTSKMDFMENQSFADISLEDEDVVVLPDFSGISEEKEAPVLPKKQPAVLRQSFNQFTETSLSRSRRKKAPKRVEKKENAEIKSVEIPKEIRLYEFADKIGKNTSEIISKLFMLGMMTTKNDFLDETAIEILAEEFGIEISIIDEASEFDYIKEYEQNQDNKNLQARAPVITIMGHVDHGKTSLLDFIRKSRVANAEAGGITQHVGAYMVEKNGRKITFIDTPGHEAFTAMRARGASITDIVIIVVAADDGVKPQTKEAINHAKAANVPIIIAINKIDKEDANPDLVKTQLAEMDIVPTEWGGKYEFVSVSAKKGTGIEDLLEIVLLQADILELKADPKAAAKASIVESSVQKGRGPVATIIVQNGTLRVGNTIVAGVAYGKVRAMSDDSGKAMKEIKPGECGVIVGLSEVADAGETLICVASDKEAREYANKRHEYNRQKELSKSTKVSLDELGAKIKEGNLKSLPVILKADVQGSLEAIKASLEKLKNDEIKVNIIHAAVGGITQSDIELASASEDSVVLGFNIRPTGEIKERAKEKGVQIKTYNVIYNLIDDVKALLSGMMSPIISEEQLGQAQIRQVITVPKIGQIAGCMVTEGVINRGAKIRLIRDGVVVFEGNVSSLKRFKDDVREVAKGYECGVGIEGCNDMKEGDYIESYKEVKEQASL
ncbi:translation initiation factor IF-2 [Campylobacter sp. MIT 99-7217]|uniref:translation initiation factor IF-2 n=1 Tax=Campylobacter sp. MIT 99-7217 TaxID=535091 RepID=UPI00115A178B|nr:translation initiation factor IF-2 [Campylobacter sp. MIT 99-7217]TQR31287.1 translation initiation factor IF-2 [Campylobacter sp. MIT 99-7217]